MANLRLAATAAALTLAAFASPAFAQVSSAADCEYEGGEIFNVQGATVCLVQIRPEEYRDNEAYDGQQLGVNSCSGDVLNNGLFCKITLVAAPPKPVAAAPVELTDAVMTEPVMTEAETAAPEMSAPAVAAPAIDAAKSVVVDMIDDAK